MLSSLWLPESVFISPSLLNDSFAKYRILDLKTLDIILSKFQIVFKRRL